MAKRNGYVWGMLSVILSSCSIASPLQYEYVRLKFKSNRDKYDAAIGECNEQLRVLREKKENILEQLNHNEKARKEMERIEKHLTEDMVVIPEFNDGFIRRMVTSIRVTQDNNLQICIKGGYEIMASFPCDKNAA